MAGLPETKAWVCVGPPLKASTGLRMLAELDPCWRYDIGGAGSEADNSGVAVDTKKVEGIRRDSGIVLKISGAVGAVLPAIRLRTNVTVS